MHNPIDSRNFVLISFLATITFNVLCSNDDTWYNYLWHMYLQTNKTRGEKERERMRNTVRTYLL